MRHITISEVGPRDGLQSVETILSTEGKLAWIEMEYGAGVREIEVGSFVSKIVTPDGGYSRCCPGSAISPGSGCCCSRAEFAGL